MSRDVGPAGDLADIVAMEQRPLEAATPFASSFALLKRSAALYGDRPAIQAIDLEGGREGLTYSGLLNGVVSVANAYAQAGLGRGEVVAVILPNLVETHLCIWAAEAIGAVCLINPFLDPAHIAAILKAVKARIVVTEPGGCDGEIDARVADALDADQTARTVLTVRTRFGPDARSVPTEAGRRPGRHVAVAPLAWSADVGAIPAFSPVVEADAVASYLHTGGTTGAPKVAPRTHRNMTSQAWTVSGVLGLEPSDVLVCGLPLFHTNGVTVTGLAPFARGACVLLATAEGYRNPGVLQRFWTLARRHGVTHFAGVPTIYSRLLESFDGPAPSLKFGICGAAPMSTELFRTFERETGVPIVEGYGLTEAGCVSTLNPVHGTRKVGSIGLRLPYQTMRIVRAARTPLEDCGPDEAGLLLIDGPNVFNGYLGAPADAHGLLEGRWLNTGDLARMDADGYVWLTGRAKDLIIRGGHNIDPAIGEAALSAHPDVALAAVVGRPHADLGETPIGYVTLRPDRRVDAESLAAFARETATERAAAPRHVRILDALPVTAVGKIYKPALRLMATREAVNEALGQEEPAHLSLDPAGAIRCRIGREGPAAEAARRTVERLAPYIQFEG